MARQSKVNPKAKKTAKNPELFKKISEALYQLRQRQKAKYDGVVGSLPKWVPDPLRQEFQAVRNDLLDKYDHEDLLQYLNGRKRMFREEGFRGLPYYPEIIEDKIDSLIYIQQLVDLKKEKGIKAYLGKGGIKVVRGIALSEMGRKGGKKRAGKLNPLHSTIKKLNLNNWEEILKAFKDYEKMKKLFKEGEIDINIDVVNYETKKVLFVKLRNPKDKDSIIQYSISFKSLQNRYPVKKSRK